MSSIANMLLRTPKDIGALIRQRRADLALDQKTLAERVGVSRQWVIEIERGKARAELALVLRTLDVLGVRLSTGSERVHRAPAATRRTSPEARDAAPDIDAVVNAARKPRR